MKFNSDENSSLQEIEVSPPNHPEVAALFARLSDLEPQAMAEALCHLEILKTLPYVLSNAQIDQDQPNKIFSSRDLKGEMEKIYLELAKHLQARSQGSRDLMNAIFDFLDETLGFLLEVPNLLSNN